MPQKSLKNVTTKDTPSRTRSKVRTGIAMSNDPVPTFRFFPDSRGPNCRHEKRNWCRRRDSNPRPTHYECVALPPELLRPSLERPALYGPGPAGSTCPRCPLAGTRGSGWSTPTTVDATPRAGIKRASRCAPEGDCRLSHRSAPDGILLIGSRTPAWSGPDRGNGGLPAPAGSPFRTVAVLCMLPAPTSMNLWKGGPCPTTCWSQGLPSSVSRKG